MERLTERDAYWIGEEFWTSAREPDDEEIDAVYEKLKAYEDLEEQGLLLRLPCKVGDTIYCIGTMCDFGDEPSDFCCDNVDCEECLYGNELVIKERTAKEFHIRKFLEGTAKLDFLTKEEAEQALAKMKEV